MEISRRVAELIVSQVNRKCYNCEADLIFSSIRCVKCGRENPLEKVVADSYYEHYEITQCKEHGSKLHYCVHPKIDSKIYDLKHVCVECCKVVLDLGNRSN